jgi:DNA-binding HxlR family transcriptional regulator
MTKATVGEPARNRSEIEGCPAEHTLEFLSGRWKPMIVYWLLQGERRFNQLQRDLGGVTHRTLARTLREMEEDGLIARRDYGEVPPRVDYRLTALGRSLSTVLEAMHAWALAHPAARTIRRQG